MNKFKIGDRVVCPKKPENADEVPRHLAVMNPYIGVVGSGVGISIAGDIRVEYRDDFWFYQPSWIIHESEWLAANRTFNAGDEVYWKHKKYTIQRYALEGRYDLFDGDELLSRSVESSELMPAAEYEMVLPKDTPEQPIEWRPPVWPNDWGKRCRVKQGDQWREHNGGMLYELIGYVPRMAEPWLVWPGHAIDLLRPILVKEVEVTQ